MNIVTEIKNWQRFRNSLANASIGFIPTMGHLHDGHKSLCERSMRENDHTVISIFINPTQFNRDEDFKNYPRTLDKDIQLLSSLGVDYLIVPSHTDLYADQYQIQVTETDISKDLEGHFRPGHFNGVLTIVLKLLNLVQATRAYFGEKDYQQMLLIKKMAAALFLPVDIVSCPTIRSIDGLALSSRNSRLTQEQRQLAVHFPRVLNSLMSIDEIRNQLEGLGFKVDYITDKWHRRLGAVWLGDIRLIDNFPIA